MKNTDLQKLIDTINASGGISIYTTDNNTRLMAASVSPDGLTDCYGKVAVSYRGVCYWLENYVANL